MEGFEFRKIALLGSLYGMVVLAPASAMADNGGLSFWLPGTSAALRPPRLSPGGPIRAGGEAWRIQGGASQESARRSDFCFPSPGATTAT
jgi:hypothetical protein